MCSSFEQLSRGTAFFRWDFCCFFGFIILFLSFRLHFGHSAWDLFCRCLITPHPCLDENAISKFSNLFLWNFPFQFLQTFSIWVTSEDIVFKNFRRYLYRILKADCRQVILVAVDFDRHFQTKLVIKDCRNSEPHLDWTAFLFFGRRRSGGKLFIYSKN